MFIRPQVYINQKIMRAHKRTKDRWVNVQKNLSVHRKEIMFSISDLLNRKPEI